MNIDLYKTVLYYHLKYLILDNNIVIKNENKFYYNKDEIIRKDDIPDGITHLIFGSKFNKILKKEDIPYGVKNIRFGYDYQQKLKKGVIPSSVTHLYFDTLYNQPIEKDVIPSSVQHLEFGYLFNQKLNKDNLPQKLIELILYNNEYDTTHLKDLNILIGKIDRFIKYNDDNIQILYYEKMLLNKYIEKYMVKNKGDIILQELVEKVFHPSRLLKICEKYNIEFTDLIEIY